MFRLCRLNSWIITVWMILCAFFALFSTAQAQQSDARADRVESPYFAVEGASGVETLPLKDTKVDVRIIGVIADVTVTQHYRNEGKTPIEARYVFPGSTRSAVYAMNVQLGDRVLTAEIREKQKAKEEYDAAKREGKTAALLEQHRPNVFGMNVANIMPNDDVKVELHYTELLVPRDGTYQFMFPTVVGPRYNGSSEEGDQATKGKKEKWISTPYLHEGQESPTAFALNVDLATPVAVQDLNSPSHKIESRKISDQEQQIKLAKTGKNENNRDFVLNYRLSGEQIQSGILMSRGAKGADGQPGENFFLAMMEPPKVVDSGRIVPREYVFVVDISGSMHGFPLDTAKGLLNELIGGLRNVDTFNVLLFSGSSRMLSKKSMPATRDNIEQALDMLNQQMGSGGTELVPALKTALALPEDQERSRSFIVVTDGYVTVEREAFELVRNNLSKANMFAFGIGTSVNRELIEGLARAGQGEPFIILNKDAAQEEAQRFRKMIDSPVLTHIQAKFEGLDVYDVEPLALPDVFAQRPVILFGKWRGESKGKLELQGQAANGPYRTQLAVTPDLPQATNTALSYLWARHRVAALSDQDALEGGNTFKKAITEIGLKYSLLTQYTSFIAVDQVVRNANPQDSTSVNQPVPLPQGVSNQAIGAAVSSTPEPSSCMLMIIALLGMTWFQWNRRRAVK